MTRSKTNSAPEREGSRVVRNARFERQLVAYAAAAGAAGVGMLAVAQQAQAKVIYKHANIPINVDQQTFLDLNGDGNEDFAFYNLYINGVRRREGTFQASVDVGPAQTGNAIVEAFKNGKLLGAAALEAGVPVGPKRRVGSQYLLMASSGGNYTGGGGGGGPWLKAQNGYLGFKFQISGQTHYAWARIQWNGLGHTEYITGYAYESVANKPIVTGKWKGTAELNSARTLGVLARGASGTSTQ